MSILVYDETPPDPKTIRCTCGSYDIRVRSSMPGESARISYLLCNGCQREWKVRGQVQRALIIQETT